MSEFVYTYFSVPYGLEDVSKYPDLFDALFQSNSTLWTQKNLEKLAGGNLLRVFASVEDVSFNVRFMTSGD